MISFYFSAFCSYLSRLWAPLLHNKNFYYSLFGSGIFLFISIYIQNAVSRYNDIVNHSTYVEDTLHQILPLWDLSFLYFTGTFIFLGGVVAYGLFWKPSLIPFGIFTFGLFVLVRSGCISLTHLGVPPEHIIPSGNGGGIIRFFQNDLFFSGHTGGPFLLSLLAWKEKWWRNIFFLTSVAMAFSVLSMRLHYSIDIIGAYFITYGVFCISQWIWNIRKT